ncbi:MAG: oxidoreductase [Nocardioides sp.]|nr:oxidoreductase [Nocardioides sp.]
METPLRAGLIGAGFIGSVHAHAIRASGARLSRVSDSTPERALEAARRLGAEAAAESAEALIASDDIDVVHICTPNATHADLAERAIAAGKTVICEKPLATSLADADRLVAAADRAGVVTAVPFVYRYYPSVREARALIDAGAAGRLWLLHGSYLQDWLSNSGETNWRVDPSQGGGSRAFGDIGVHWCDLMEFVTGHRITRLMARMSNAHSERPTAEGMKSVGTEDGVTLMFETDRGATGSLVASQVSLGRKNKLWFSFDGTEAAYVFDQENPDSLWVGGANESRILPRGPGGAGSRGEGPDYSFLPAGHPQGYQDCFNAFVADVYAVATGARRDGLPTFTDGRRAAKITEAVIDSAKNESWTEVLA